VGIGSGRQRMLAMTCVLLSVAVPSRLIGQNAKQSVKADPKLGDSRVNPKDGLRYRWIPPGNVTTGCSPGDDECYEDEFPARKVILTHGFWLSETEVTQAAYERVLGDNPSIFEGPTLPVEMVTWNDADAYCSEIGGRLPTEAEWEYAARAGTTSSRYGNLDDIAWYWNNSNLSTHPVGLKKPNAFGLYDMLGNVVEWTYTWYTVQHSQENINPKGPSTAEFKSLKGGGWWDEQDLVRASYRARIEPGDTDYNIGFRCAMDN
jgi:formylglycine-generating enzyme